ncbi:MAG: ABC transporter ATP-binding protein [Chloroflexi bacterium]|nr:ABC transporter ATP-binding protein [Chloroflexota bacterium]
MHINFSRLSGGTEAARGRATVGPTEASITIRGLRVVRGGAPILRDVSLEIRAGTVYGLVGPSGSGKTTLIRSIIGRQRIAAGEIRVGDLPAGSAALRRLIGYMPQNAAVYNDLTARENLEFFGTIYQAPATRVDEVLDLVDLRRVADRAVSTFSGGERQRVALAAALLPAPPLLVLDEPTVGLDPRLRHRLWAQFRAWAAAGTTLLVSTHVMDEAARTDRLVLLTDGEAVAEGTPAELLARAGAADLEEAVLRLTERTAVGAVGEEPR